MSTFATIAPTSDSLGTDEFLLDRGSITYKQTRNNLGASIANTRWDNTNTYLAGTRVIASNLNEYKALVDNGVGTVVGAVDPIAVNKSVWVEVNTQFGEYEETRSYQTGDIVFTRDTVTGEASYWQWYSNVESLSGKDPLDVDNRHEGWTDNTKPFYWIPYTGGQVGMPFYWLDTSAPEWAVMEINVDLPITVYWRLARRYPSLVTGGVINSGEIRGEFLRVLDQGRGVDIGRVSGDFQDHQIQDHQHALNKSNSPGSLNDWFAAGGIFSGGTTSQGVLSGSANFGSETRPRNVARPMAITI